MLMSDPSDRRFYDGSDEATLQAKASAARITGIGSRRGVFGDGGRRIRKRADSECTAVARHLTASCRYS
jgi:hypothetical protein